MTAARTWLSGAAKRVEMSLKRVGAKALNYILMNEKLMKLRWLQIHSACSVPTYSQPKLEWRTEIRSQVHSNASRARLNLN